MDPLWIEWNCFIVRATNQRIVMKKPKKVDIEKEAKLCNEFKNFIKKQSQIFLFSTRTVEWR